MWFSIDSESFRTENVAWGDVVQNWLRNFGEELALGRQIRNSRGNCRPSEFSSRFHLSNFEAICHWLYIFSANLRHPASLNNGALSWGVRPTVSSSARDFLVPRGWWMSVIMHLAFLYPTRLWNQHYAFNSISGQWTEASNTTFYSFDIVSKFTEIVSETWILTETFRIYYKWL